MITPYDPIRAANIATGIREKRSIEADKVAKRLEKEANESGMFITESVKES